MFGGDGDDDFFLVTWCGRTIVGLLVSWIWTWSPRMSCCGGRAHTKMNVRERWKWEAEGKSGLVVRWGIRSSGLSHSKDGERTAGNGKDAQKRDGKLVAGWLHLSLEERVSEEEMRHVFSTALNGNVNWSGVWREYWTSSDGSQRGCNWLWDQEWKSESWMDWRKRTSWEMRDKWRKMKLPAMTE